MACIESYLFALFKETHVSECIGISGEKLGPEPLPSLPFQTVGASTLMRRVYTFDQRDSSKTLHRQCNVFRLVHRRRFHLLQFAYTLKSNVALLDTRDIPTRRRVGILFNIPKSNHYKFPRNPYYRCMSEWNGLRADTTLLPTRDSFKKAIVAGIPNPFIKVLH